MKTVPVGVVSDLIRADVYFWGSLMAAGILGSSRSPSPYSFSSTTTSRVSPRGATKG